MASVKIVLTGDRELNRMLKRLALKDAKKIVRKAARPALKPVLLHTKRNAPEDTGQLKKSIKVRALKRSRRFFGARVSTSKQDYVGDQFYASFQEWGWRAGPRRLGNQRREIEGQKFMLRAAVEKRRSVLTIYRTLIRRELLRVLKTQRRFAFDERSR